MIKPRLESYGLTQEQAATLEEREKRLSSSLSNSVATAFALGGFLIVAANSAADIGGAFASLAGAYFGLLISTPFAHWAKSLTKKFDARFQRVSDFKAELKAFEEWDLRTRCDFWQSMSGRRFEHELAALFKRQGYSVTVTPGSGDGGIDIILKRTGRTTAVQCKQTRKPVGPAVVRELYGAMMASNVDDGILAALGGATIGVHDFCEDKPIRVMDLSEIIELHRLYP